MNLALRRANGNPNTLEFTDNERSLFGMSPQDHATVLHPPLGHPVNVKFGFGGGGVWEEVAVPLTDLQDYIESLEGRTNVYITQNVFKGPRRRVCDLAGLRACYVDIDFHTTVRWQRETPQTVSDAVRIRLDDHGMPAPSYILSTGRGIVVVWLLDDTSARALPRWLPVQQALAKSLHGFGVDNIALDAARVFRVSGTINGKSGRKVGPIWMSGPLNGLNRYGFDQFSDEVLEFTREEMRQKAAERALRRGDATPAQVLSLDFERARSGKARRPTTHLTKLTLWDVRFCDLNKLRFGRWKDGLIPPGYRDAWILIAVVAIGWLTPPYDKIIKREAAELGWQAARWSASETHSRMSAVYGRYYEAWDGGKRQWRGREVDPRYSYRKETIINLLDITEDEMRRFDLQTLVTDAVQRERKTATMRRLRGSDEKAAAKAHLKEQAHVMAAAGAKQGEIAATLGVDRTTISRWLKS